jgi:hypothetical protein
MNRTRRRVTCKGAEEHDEHGTVAILVNVEEYLAEEREGEREQQGATTESHGHRSQLDRHRRPELEGATTSVIKTFPQRNGMLSVVPEQFIHNFVKKIYKILFIFYYT